MPLDPTQKVPARFLRDGEHLLEAQYTQHKDGNNKPYRKNSTDVTSGKAELGILAGDTLMVYPQEVYGQTMWHDPKNEQPSLFIGIGHVCLPEHADLSKDELVSLGYQFHGPCEQFEPLFSLEHFDPDVSQRANTAPLPKIEQE